MSSIPAAKERLIEDVKALRANSSYGAAAGTPRTDRSDRWNFQVADDLDAILAELSRLEEENRRFAKAVFMVGNMDTEHDKAAWWADHRADWERAASLITKGGVDV